MKLKSLGTTFSRAIKNSSYMAISNVLLAIALLLAVIKIFTLNERLVLTPPHMDKKMMIAWDHADQAYYETWGMYVATLIGNVTPKTVTLVADALGTFIDAPIYPKLRNEILSLADDPVFQKANAINYFAPDRTVFEIDETGTRKVFVVGQLVTSSLEPAAMLNGPRTEPKWVTYEWTMEMRMGRPWIVAYDSYKGNQPHTMKWKAAQQSTQPKQTSSQTQQQNQQQETTQ